MEEFTLTCNGEVIEFDNEIAFVKYIGQQLDIKNILVSRSPIAEEIEVFSKVGKKPSSTDSPNAGVAVAPPRR